MWEISYERGWSRRRTIKRNGGGARKRGRDEKSIRDLKELSTPGNSVVGYDAKRMTGPGRLFPTKDGRAEVRGNGMGFPKRFGLVRGTTPNPPAPGVSNYPLRSGCSGSGNHQPISLSARSRVVIVPGVHCAPIVIGYQRYFCLNCRTLGRSLLPMEGYVRIAKLSRCRIGSKRPQIQSTDQTIETLAFMTSSWWYTQISWASSSWKRCKTSFIITGLMLHKTIVAKLSELVLHSRAFACEQKESI